ncbi:MAG: hypothetical protein DCC75_11975 [Proteobacteria bacterium]|nr:MAG: hypothetical protein DCC75_11975 [Pseudomonadota bacterium]
MSPRKPAASPCGFTLMELMIAISILSLVLSVAYSSLRQITRGKQLLDDSRDAHLIANSVLVRMTRELQLLVRDPGSNLLPPASNLNSARYGVLEGIRGNINSDAADSITFLAVEGGQYLPDGGAHSGIVQISYRVAEDPEQEGDPTPRYLFIRDEVPYIRPPDQAYKKIMTFPITNRLVSLEFSYFDPEKEQWIEEWQAAASNKAPSMIRFSLSVESPRGRIDQFSTVVPVGKR